MTSRKPEHGRSLADLFPEIASQAVGWNPKMFGIYVKKSLKWRCTLNHEWYSNISNRVQFGKGCPYCSNQKVLSGFNDLATTHPEIAFQAVGWDPQKVIAGSGKRFLWRCHDGHEWTASSGDRVKGHGCPFCSNQKVLSGFNDLATTHPEIAFQAVGWDPQKVIAGSGKRFLWRCHDGHEWTASSWARVKGHGCPFCSGLKVLAGFNDLGTTHPELALQAVGWNPKEVSAGSGKKLLWRCELGHEWRSRVANRSSNKSGCPSCSQKSFDPNREGWLYFIEHDEWQMFQIGITNFPNDRLSDHKRIGWNVLEIRGAMDGSATRALETAILQSLKRRGAVFANKSDGRKFDGWSESWLKSSVKVSGLKDLLDFVHEDEQIKK